ncbi:MAG: hypothetical protein GC204_19615 [Chloroflexi bacterium]|nr:hypothetical protein [Chloroflexota bacterium]
MRKLTARLSVLCAAALLVFAPAFARVTQAQDSMKHVCDSTLITLLFIAESDYGYHGMDTSVYDKGQFTSMFEAMMAHMDDSMMMTPTEEMMMGDDSMMMTPTEEMMMGDAMMTTLTPGIMANEDPACTALRADLEAFFYKHYSDMSMDSGM